MFWKKKYDIQELVNIEDASLKHPSQLDTNPQDLIVDLLRYQNYAQDCEDRIDKIQDELESYLSILDTIRIDLQQFIVNNCKLEFIKNDLFGLVAKRVLKLGSKEAYIYYYRVGNEVEAVFGVN